MVYIGTSAVITISMGHSSCGLVHALWVHICKHKQLSIAITMQTAEHREIAVITVNQMVKAQAQHACLGFTAYGGFQVTATDTAYQLVGARAQVCTQIVHMRDSLQLNVQTAVPMTHR